MDHRGTGHKKIPQEVVDAIGNGRARDFYVLCEKNGLSFDAFGDIGRDLYFLGEMEMDEGLERVNDDVEIGVRAMEIRRGGRYSQFLDEVGLLDVPVGEFGAFSETKRRLVKKYFPGKSEEWKELKDGQLGYRFSRLVEYSRKLEDS